MGKNNRQFEYAPSLRHASAWARNRFNNPERDTWTKEDDEWDDSRVEAHEQATRTWVGRRGFVGCRFLEMAVIKENKPAASTMFDLKQKNSIFTFP